MKPDRCTDTAPLRSNHYDHDDWLSYCGRSVAVLEPLLPFSVNTYRFGGSRPHMPDRCCADASGSVLRTGS
jgi:hypothetical protein